MQILCSPERFLFDSVGMSCKEIYNAHTADPGSASIYTDAVTTQVHSYSTSPHTHARLTASPPVDPAYTPKYHVAWNLCLVMTVILQCTHGATLNVLSVTDTGCCERLRTDVTLNRASDGTTCEQGERPRSQGSRSRHNKHKGAVSPSFWSVLVRIILSQSDHTRMCSAVQCSAWALIAWQQPDQRWEESQLHMTKKEKLL